MEKGIQNVFQKCVFFFFDVSNKSERILSSDHFKSFQRGGKGGGGWGGNVLAKHVSGLWMIQINLKKLSFNQF